MIKFVDMFSGIGGFREGLTRAGGFECVGHCEIDKYANRSYNALFDTKGEWFIEDARKADPSTIVSLHYVEYHKKLPAKIQMKSGGTKGDVNYATHNI